MPAAYNIQTWRQVDSGAMGRTRRKAEGTPFFLSALGCLPSSLANCSKKAFSAFDWENPGAGSMREDCSAPIAGIVSLTIDSYSRRASRQVGQTARRCLSLFCSSSFFLAQWPEVKTAQSSRNSSWGPLGNNAPAPTAKDFYHTASLPGNLPAKICFRSFSSPR
jgi:hypothetical protein